MQIKKMIILFMLIVLFSIINSFGVRAEEKVDPQGILAIAKIAGSCGIMDSLVDFQKRTKMQGGDEFVSRFWALEATRLGMSVKEYSDKCDASILAYNKLWQVMEDSSKRK